MSHLSKQKKLLEELVQPERDAFIGWYTSEFNHDSELHNLRNNPKIADKILLKIKKLKSLRLTFEQIRKYIKGTKKKMWQEINEQYWWIEKEDMYKKYKGFNEPDANYHKLGWTLRLLDSVEEIEKDKSNKLKTFEYGYKKAVARGDPIDELDDEVKERISKYLRKKSFKRKQRSKK